MSESTNSIEFNDIRRYVFSGSLTNAMSDYLVEFMKMGKFEPIDVLVSQLDRPGIKAMLKHAEKGIIKSMFIDSGAYSEHSQGIKIDVDEYISYVNGLDDHICAVAQVDHIPGVFKQAKKPEDYVESARLSWENFLYMYPKMKSPEKLVAVFHQGESFEHLKNMLEWKDPNGKPLQYIGISPSNDRTVQDKDIYLRDVYSFIAKSNNPRVHTHLFGYTSMPGLSKFPWFSCDSVSHRLRAAYNKMFVSYLKNSNGGDGDVISFSKTRIAKDKASQCYLDICDESSLKVFKEFLKGYGVDDPERLCDDSSLRTAIDMCEVQKFVKSHPYVPQAVWRPRQLFGKR